MGQRLLPSFRSRTTQRVQFPRGVNLGRPSRRATRTYLAFPAHWRIRRSLRAKRGYALIARGQNSRLGFPLAFHFGVWIISPICADPRAAKAMKGDVSQKNKKKKIDKETKSKNWFRKQRQGK